MAVDDGLTFVTGEERLVFIPKLGGELVYGLADEESQEDFE